MMFFVSSKLLIISLTSSKNLIFISQSMLTKIESLFLFFQLVKIGNSIKKSIKKSFHQFVKPRSDCKLL